METKRIDLTKDQKLSIQESELKELQEQQIAEANGTEKVETVEGNRDPKHRIRKIESLGYVHVWTRIKHLDASGKNFTYEDKVVMIHNREFAQRVKDGAFTLFDEVTVIHDPRKNAPTEYDLKPEQIDVDKQVGPNTGTLKVVDEKESNRLKVVEKNLKAREDKIAASEERINKSIDEAEQRLAKREAALAEREAKLNTPVAAPPVETKGPEIAKQSPATTAAKEDNKAK
jgi:hypothetical protein